MVRKLLVVMAAVPVLSLGLAHPGQCSGSHVAGGHLVRGMAVAGQDRL